MAGKFLVLLVFTIVAVYGRSVNEESKHWAVIVAGSNGWYNYRHQADACHAYQIVRKNGIPEERIITMMYDDIAFNEENPTPGKIINRPDGPDVYHGVKIDYKGEDVNPKNFLNVLSGDQKAMENTGSGRVLESGPNDHVFVNFVDHGAPGILAFGREFLHATDLHNTIMEMHENKRYKEMVFYVEACESGSIFADTLLPKDINVYATTAANAHESSYACYMDKERKTFLGDVYSVKWMEDSDKENLQTETLKKQYEIVKRETNTSHVQEFGDLTMGSEDVGEFQGKNRGGYYDSEPIPNPNLDAVKSEDVELNIIELKLRMATDPAERQKYEMELERLILMRETTREIFKHIVALSTKEGDTETVNDLMTERRTLRSFDCYQPVVEHLKKACPGLNIVQNDFGLRHLYTLVNLCEKPTSVDTITDAIEKTAEEVKLCNNTE